MLLSRKKKKETRTKETLFKREAHIPKKRLQKKERTVPLRLGQKRGRHDEGLEKSMGRKILVLFLWIAFWGEVVYVVFFAGFLTVNQIEIEKSGEVISEEQIKAIVQNSWQGKWYQTIPKNNLLLIRSSRQEKELLHRYPKLETVRITKHFPDTLKVSVTEQPYQLLWCREAECFLVAKDGKTKSADVFFQYPEEQGQVIRIQDVAEASVQPGTQVLRPGEQQFIHELAVDFPIRTGLTLEGPLERPTLAARELRVRTNKEFAIFFNTELPVADSLNHLMLLLQKEIPESEWDKIDYIDLRTENRVYYTRKDRAPEKTEEQIKREEEAEKKRKEEEEKNKES